MHGRLKVRTSEEQQALKQKEQQKKLAAYHMGMERILETRKKDSYEPESFSLCTQLLANNPDIYTLWNYRKEVVLMEIEKSQKDEVDGEDTLITFLENEISLTEQCLISNPKSYGAWHHRYWVMMKHPKPNWENEFTLCTKYLTKDDRNFHCWDYRRLIVNKIGITLTDELQFSTDRLNVNFSNYSSWHYRSTLRKLDGDSVGFELHLIQNAVFTDPADSSAWFYLRWVLSDPTIKKQSREELLDSFEQLEELEPDCKCKDEFLPKDSFMSMMSSAICSGEIGSILCSNAFFAVCGFSPKKMNTSLVPQLVEHYPAGVATKQVLHYGQEIPDVSVQRGSRG